LFSY